MVFIGTVLAKTPGVKNSKDIRARLLRRMDHWTDGHTGALVEDTCGTRKAIGVCAGSISEQDKEESAAMSYDSKLKAGHIQAAVHQATDRGNGGVLHVNSTDPKSGIFVLDTLRQKHPDLQEVDLSHPECSAFKGYPARPTVLPIDITGHEIKETVREMGGVRRPQRSGLDGTKILMHTIQCRVRSSERRAGRMYPMARKRVTTMDSIPRLDGRAPHGPRQMPGCTSSGNRQGHPTTHGESCAHNHIFPGHGGVQEPQPLRRAQSRHRGSSTRKHKGLWEKDPPKFSLVRQPP